MTIPKKWQWTRAESTRLPLTRSMLAGACQFSCAKSNISTISWNRTTTLSREWPKRCSTSNHPLRRPGDCWHRAHARDPQGAGRNGSHSEDAGRRSILCASRTGPSNLRAEVPSMPGKHRPLINNATDSRSRLDGREPEAKYRRCRFEPPQFCRQCLQPHDMVPRSYFLFAQA